MLQIAVEFVPRVAWCFAKLRFPEVPGGSRRFPKVPEGSRFGVYADFGSESQDNDWGKIENR